MIRYAKIEDLNNILEIYNDINNKEMIEDVKYTFEDFICYIKAKLIKVFDDGKVKGFVLFFDHITWGYIELLCVKKNQRNKGIGKKLLDSVNDSRWGVVELCCHINDSDIINFVKKHNFIESNQCTYWYYKK